MSTRAALEFNLISYSDSDATNFKANALCYTLSLCCPALPWPGLPLRPLFACIFRRAAPKQTVLQHPRKGRGKMLSKYAVEKYLHKSNERIRRRLTVSRKTGKSESETRMKKLHFPGKCFAHKLAHTHTCWSRRSLRPTGEKYAMLFACGTQLSR